MHNSPSPVRRPTNGTIVFAGTFEPGSIGGSYLRALEATGQTVHVFDFGQQVVRNRMVQRLRGWPVIGRLLEDRALEHLNYQLCDLIHQVRPDLLLTNNGTFLLPGTLVSAQQLGCATANLWGEPLLHFNQWNVMASIPFYDTIFVFARAMMPYFAHARATRIEYLPLAYDPELHPPVSSHLEEGGEPDAASLVFIGKWSPERERLLEPLCDLDLDLWGDKTWSNYASPDSPVRDHWRGREITGAEYARACAEAKICLNFVEPAAQESANMRTFELTGMGNFMLAPRNQEHQALFVEGEEIAMYGSPLELREQVERYLTRDAERARMGAKARAKVLAHHTYAHRVEYVLNVMSQPSESALRKAA